MRPLKLPFISPVSGVSQYQAEVVLVKVGDSVLIKHDPLNPYDTNACEVFFNKKRLGFIPKELAARLVLSGEMWAGEVVEVLEGKSRGLRVRVSELSVSSESAPAKAPDPVTQKSQAVYSLAGRRLGKYLRSEDSSVIVLNGSDMEVPYPKALVELR